MVVADRGWGFPSTTVVATTTSADITTRDIASLITVADMAVGIRPTEVYKSIQRPITAGATMGAATTMDTAVVVADTAADTADTVAVLGIITITKHRAERLIDPQRSSVSSGTLLFSLSRLEGGCDKSANAIAGTPICVLESTDFVLGLFLTVENGGLVSNATAYS